MKNQRQMWTSEEEEALKSGVAKYGTGRWKNILTDPDLSSFFNHRTNIDLKDKWRNLTPRVKAITSGPLSSAQSSASASPIAKDEPFKNQPNGKTASRYSDMIFEALLTISDSNGCDLGAIVSSIERRHEVPQNFRRLLGSNLRKLVLQGKLEKIQNCYKIKDAALGTKTPSPKQNGIRSRPSQKPVKLISSETLEDAATTAACMIAEAENKSLVAAEAVREAERVSNMVENAESVLQLVKQIYEQCLRGEIVVLA